MKDIIEDLDNIHDKAYKESHPLLNGKEQGELKSLLQALDEVGLAWSESWIGYHAFLYIKSFRPKGSGDSFDVEWGLNEAFSNGSRGSWHSYNLQDVEEQIESITNASIKSLQKTAENPKTTFEECKRKLLPILHALSSTQPSDSRLQEALKETDELDDCISRNDFIKYWRPSQYMSRDSRAMMQGLKVPPHLQIKAILLEIGSSATNLKRLGQIAGDVANYLKTKQKIAPALEKPKSTESTGSKVFIGHGGSSAWKDLKAFLTDTLHLECEEFNIQSAAGLPISQRLEEMANRAAFAFLVLTGEDEHSDSTIHARENVIHEVGYFQGKLGFRKAIVLLELGCDEFSNITGLGQIRFYKGDIMSKSEEIRKVLWREGLIP